jgi:hypothetical protein|tara:strand:+ start:335 stop:1012 length:678 start_codon:yes stop_codon:yes gene_type:complete
VSDGVKLGQLLCDADIITKRQLSKALQEQVKGRKGTIGEILVDMGFCSFDDITDALMNSSTDTKQHEEKHEEIHKEPIQPEMVTGLPPNKPEPVREEPKEEEPIEVSEEKIMGTKFTMSLQTLGALVALLASGIGGYYMLLQEIEEAKNLPEPPSIESIFGDEYPSKPDGHNWPRSYEQYKTQVGGLQKDMDEVYEYIEEFEEKIEDLEKLVSNLRVEVAKKKDK